MVSLTIFHPFKPYRYQSTNFGSFETIELLDTFVNYHESIRRCVCIIYDPQNAKSGQLGQCFCFSLGGLFSFRIESDSFERCFRRRLQIERASHFRKTQIQRFDMALHFLRDSDLYSKLSLDKSFHAGPRSNWLDEKRRSQSPRSWRHTIHRPISFISWRVHRRSHTRTQEGGLTS